MGIELSRFLLEHGIEIGRVPGGKGTGKQKYGHESDPDQ
jgi:hypothetical protein